MWEERRKGRKRKESKEGGGKIEGKEEGEKE